MYNNLGIVDLRNIISSIKEYYEIDFSNYAHTSFKRRIEKFIFENHFNSAKDLISKIIEDKNFFDLLLKQISINDTEMYRDPTLWKTLRDNIISHIPILEDFKIWLPESTSGEELYSLAILLKEMSRTDKVKILATSLSQKNIESIKAGAYDVKKMDINIANYDRFQGKFHLTTYFTVSNGIAFLDPTLIEHVEFKKFVMLKEKAPKGMKIVLFRNKMLYYNRILQNQITDYIYESMLPGGFLIFGNKESIEDSCLLGRFSVYNKEEKIYRKIVG